MAGAIKSVEGVKIIKAPAKGSGENGFTMVVVELGEKVSLGKLIMAVEGAKTPHAEKVAPGVLGAVPVKLKADTTPEAFLEALRKAGLLDE